MASNKQYQVKTKTPSTARNVVDLTYTSHLTAPIGKIIPVFCREVVPKTSVEIDPKFAFQLLPTVFPIQNRMRCDIHFFYVRNKNLWKNWENYIFGNDSSLVHPYIDPIKLDTSIGSLFDYFGGVVEDNRVNRHLGSISVPFGALNSIMRNNKNYFGAKLETGIKNRIEFEEPPYNVSVDPTTIGSDWINYYLPPKIDETQKLPILGELLSIYQSRFGVNGPYKNCRKTIIPNSPFNADFTPTSKLCITGSTNLTSIMLSVWERVITPNGTKKSDFRLRAISLSGFTVDRALLNTQSNMIEIPLDNANVKWRVAADLKKPERIMTYQEFFNWFNLLRGETNNLYLALDYIPLSNIYDIGDGSRHVIKNAYVGFNYEVSDVISTDENFKLLREDNPFYKGALKISALPFRAYESIYNSFYRNTVVDPFIKNGKPTYTEFVTNDSDGKDSTDYHIFNRLWSDDHLTTCVPNPQQGLQSIAPLQTLDSSNGTTGKAVVKYKKSVDDDVFQTLTLSYNKTGSSGNITGVLSSTQDTDEFKEMFNRAINTGISIQDLRNATALQRWLENNQKLGYRYKEQMLSNFGIELSYQYCDMPDYIGGRSRDIHFSEVLNQSGNDANMLGESVGRSALYADAGDKIYKFCEDYGFIIGVMSIVPVPVYSQLMPKFLLKTHNPLDYFNPAFNHLGYQPITYEEVCPVESFISGGAASLSRAFGYQRCWYDYVTSWDEVHGQYRQDGFSDFLLRRIFGTPPTLSPQFLSIDTNQLNNPFCINDGGDKLFGSIKFSFTVKTPVDKFVTPSITM